MQRQKRAERSDKKMRIHPYLDRATFERLDKIRQSVNTQKKSVSIHDLAEDLIDLCTQTPEVIKWIMRRYDVPSDHPMYAIRFSENGTNVIKHLFEC
ncbi:hypothetical protein ACFYU8_17800 [Brevibacillus sp. NPDC003359]|uniref:hypothetical protein n=1 Tax=unclassified Brevibacillus TaxID=2684853 RepID=UPI0036C59558